MTPHWLIWHLIWLLIDSFEYAFDCSLTHLTPHLTPYWFNWLLIWLLVDSFDSSLTHLTPHLTPHSLNWLPIDSSSTPHLFFIYSSSLMTLHLNQLILFLTPKRVFTIRIRFFNPFQWILHIFSYKYLRFQISRDWLLFWPIRLQMSSFIRFQTLRFILVGFSYLFW